MKPGRRGQDASGPFPRSGRGDPEPGERRREPGSGGGVWTNRSPGRLPRPGRGPGPERRCPERRWICFAVVRGSSSSRPSSSSSRATRCSRWHEHVDDVHREGITSSRLAPDFDTAGASAIGRPRACPSATSRAIRRLPSSTASGISAELRVASSRISPTISSDRSWKVTTDRRASSRPRSARIVGP